MLQANGSTWSCQNAEVRQDPGFRARGLYLWLQLSAHSAQSAEGMRLGMGVTQLMGTGTAIVIITTEH